MASWTHSQAQSVRYWGHATSSCPHGWATSSSLPVFCRISPTGTVGAQVTFQAGHGPFGMATSEATPLCEPPLVCRPLTSPRDLRFSHFSSSLNTTFLGRWESHMMWMAKLHYVIYCCLSVRMELLWILVTCTVFTLLFFLKKIIKM